MPADLRLLSGSGKEIDESLLTGESLPARKHPDSPPLYIPLGGAWVLRFFLERAIRLELAEYRQA